MEQEELPNLNAQHIKIDIQHKPNPEAEPQFIDVADLENTRGNLSVEKLAQLRETTGVSAFAQSNLSQ